MTGRRSPAAALIVVSLVLVACGSSATSAPTTTARPSTEAPLALTPGALGTSTTSTTDIATTAGPATTPGPASAPSTTRATPTTTTEPLATAPTVAPVVTAGPDVPAHTSCTTVIHIGDSTSVGMYSPEFMPERSQRIDAQYARVGVFDIHVDVIEGRAVDEYLVNTTSGLTAAQAFRDQGLHGCWVIALGTNDAANISKGLDHDARDRIDQMMAVAAGDPVLWVNVKTLEKDGPWAEANMVAWNAALDAARHDYPNLRVFDWAGVVRDDWFREHDRIHYTRDGYAQRARLIADALATAFPA